MNRQTGSNNVYLYNSKIIVIKVEHINDELINEIKDNYPDFTILHDIPKNDRTGPENRTKKNKY